MNEPTTGFKARFALSLRLAWDADRKGISFVGMSMWGIDIISALLPFGYKKLADAVARGDTRLGIAVGAAIGVAVATSWVLGQAMYSRFLIMGERVRMAVDHRVLLAEERLPRITHHDAPDTADRLDVLRQRAPAIAAIPSALIVAAGVTVRSALTVALIVSVHPALLLLALTSIPPIIVGRRNTARRHAAQQAAAPHRRLARHLFTVATTSVSAKEERLFGWSVPLAERHRHETSHEEMALWRAERRSVILTGLAWIPNALGYAAALAATVVLVDRGQATVGDVLLVATIGAGLATQAATLLGTAQSTQASLLAIDDLLWFEGLGHSEPTTVPVPQRLATGIHVDDVSFTYPGTAAPALRHATLHLPAGSVVAVVGDNGAGKSTLMKLLLGLHVPDEGAIRFDDGDTASMDPFELATRTTACFQDFLRFETDLADSVGLGDLPHVHDIEAIQTAIADADARDLVDRLPNGLASPLGRTWREGSDLSGGEWQKTAIARALMRQRPLLLVLDEYAASLDAEAETWLMNQYRAVARLRRDIGTVIVLVTHRLATVRLADLVAVIDNGRISAVGTHDELIAEDGPYARNFLLQSQGYT